MESVRTIECLLEAVIFLSMAPLCILPNVCVEVKSETLFFFNRKLCNIGTFDSA